MRRHLRRHRRRRAVGCRPAGHGRARQPVAGTRDQPEPRRRRRRVRKRCRTRSTRCWRKARWLRSPRAIRPKPPPVLRRRIAAASSPSARRRARAIARAIRISASASTSRRPAATAQSPTGSSRTSNDGITSPVAPTYAREIGTSFAAPHVAGTASLMLARNAESHARAGAFASSRARHATFQRDRMCALGDAVCGAGLLDAGLALQSTVSATDSAPPGTVPVIEYYRADKDHYFMTANPAEIAFFDAVSELGLPAHRRGVLRVARLRRLAPPGTPLSPVCRFYNPLAADRFELFHGHPQRVPVRDRALGRYVESRDLRRRSTCCCPTATACARPVRCRSTASSTIATTRTSATRVDLTVRRQCSTSNGRPTASVPTPWPSARRSDARSCDAQRA